MDACFKLKLKDRGFDDPDLGTGLAYFVEEVAYQEHLATATEIREPVSYCLVDHLFHRSFLSLTIGSCDLVLYLWPRPSCCE